MAEDKIIQAEVARPYVDVVGTITDLIANQMGHIGFRVKGRNGWLETEYAGRKVIIMIEENE